ncbi:hypothetical protein MTO96_037770, partial [Rhipicephalus appendiculatus]
GTVDAPAASVPDALCDAPRNAANWAGARFAGTTAIDSDLPDQLGCMDADDSEPEDGVGTSDHTPEEAYLYYKKRSYPYALLYKPHSEPPLPVEARIRVRKEQNIALISTSDPDLAEQLCHVQTLELGSRSYEVSAYVASPDNSCKGVITGALPIPTEDALMNDTVTYPPDTCASIQEPPDTFFAVRREKHRYVASTPATRTHPCTWLGGQSSGPECIWLGYRRAPRSSPTVSATATAGYPGRLW